MLPNPLFTLFNFDVYAYGMCLAIGIVACLVVFYVFTRLKKMPNKVQDFTFFVAIGAIALGFVFAKLYQAVYNYIDKGVFDFYNAGMTVMGGLIGGAVAFLSLYFGVGELYFRGKEKGLHKKEFNKILLVAPICITVAHGFGRIGCLMAGCCHGSLLSTDNYVFGGIWMKGVTNGVWGYYVPTQLYEALFLFVLAGVLSVLFIKFDVNLILPIYLIAYGVWRIIIELFRTDARGGFVLGLAPSQWQSIIFIVGGIAIIVLYKILKIPFVLKDKKTPKKESVLKQENKDE